MLNKVSCIIHVFSGNRHTIYRRLMDDQGDQYGRNYGKSDMPHRGVSGGKHMRAGNRYALCATVGEAFVECLGSSAQEICTDCNIAPVADAPQASI